MDNSAMDGYAVRTADVQAPDTKLKVAQRIMAGSVGAALVQSTTNHMYMRVIQARDYGPSTEIDEDRSRPSILQYVVGRTGGQNPLTVNRHGPHERTPLILCRDTSIDKETISLDSLARSLASQQTAPLQ
jgi:hypothetical protein